MLVNLGVYNKRVISKGSLFLDTLCNKTVVSLGVNGYIEIRGELGKQR